MVFTDSDSLEKYILNSSKVALDNTQKEIGTKILAAIMRYYVEYKPKHYIRTWQLLNIIKYGNASVSGNEAKVILKLISSKMRHNTGTWSENKILDVSMNGSHGGRIGGLDIWGETNSMIEREFEKMMRKNLIKAGLPIK